LSRLSRLFKILQAIFYLVVVSGAVFFIADLYLSRGDWSVDIAAPPRVNPMGVSLEVTVPLLVHNPSSSDVTAKLVWYNVYMNGEPIGQGLIPYLRLRPGDNRVDVTVRVDILRLPCAVIDALAEEGRVYVGASGYAMFTLMLFGRIGYRDLTVPFNTTIYELGVQLDPASRSALKLASLLCRAATGQQLPFRLP